MYSPSRVELPPPLPSVPKHRRRDKVQLSCDACRYSKARCNRQQPCQRCQARGRLCTYPSNQLELARVRAITIHDRSVINRIRQLEDTVAILSKSTQGEVSTIPVARRNSATTHSTATLTAFGVTAETRDTPGPGSLRRNSEGMVYVSSSHWSAILDNLSDLGDCMKREDQGETPTGSSELTELPNDLSWETTSNYEGPMIFSGHVAAVSKAQLIDSLPNRLIVDKLIHEYFEGLPTAYTITMTVHAPSFYRQYEAFWNDPLSVDTMWLALLYGIICVASYFRAQSPTYLDQVQEPEYLEELTQCIILAGFGRGGPYAIEALMHYTLIEILRRPDTATGNWLLMGAVLRLALRMGYHRDPSTLKGITTFQGEMRRRCWMLLYTADIVLSIEMGIPRMIKDGQWDTKSHLSVRDSDFDEDTDHLSRHDTLEKVPVVNYESLKFAMMKILGKISDLTMTITEDQNSCSNPVVPVLDGLLRQTFESFPEEYRFTDITHSHSRSLQHVLQQLSLSICLQKGLILLHRWHVLNNKAWAFPYTSSVDTETDDYRNIVASVRTCVGAAVQMLEIQHTYAGLHLDGAFGKVPFEWASTRSHDFLLATSVLCTCLYNLIVSLDTVEEVNALIENDDQLRAVRAALTRSCEIWGTVSASSAAARRAAEVVTALISRFQPQSHSEIIIATEPPLQQPFYHGVASNNDSNLEPIFLDDLHFLGYSHL